MSEIVTTELGRFRRVTDGHEKWFLWECPLCKQWGRLSDDQLAGQVSVTCDCGYHETHRFWAELVAAMQVRILLNEPLLDSCED